MADLKIGVAGGGGRMGQMLVRQAVETEGCSLVAATEVADHPAIGRDVGEIAGLGTIGVAIGDDAAVLFDAADAVLEFSVPAATVRHATLAGEARKIHVIGTTGLNAEDEAGLAAAAQQTAIVYAPNMSAGVTLMIAMVEQMSGVLDEDYDIEIVEMHHRHKVDAPSGTAIGLGQAAARGRGVELDQVAQWTRHGHTGARQRGDIGFAVLRGGDVVSEHTVVYATEGERIEFTCRGTGRQVFARGAVRAALWARDQAAGLYGMRDVLGLET